MSSAEESRRPAAAAAAAADRTCWWRHVARTPWNRRRTIVVRSAVDARRQRSSRQSEISKVEVDRGHGEKRHRQPDQEQHDKRHSVSLRGITSRRRRRVQFVRRSSSVLSLAGLVDECHLARPTLPHSTRRRWHETVRLAGESRSASLHATRTHPCSLWTLYKLAWPPPRSSSSSSACNAQCHVLAR